jgi:hypothetical protein
MKTRKGVKARIDQELASLRQRPREAEAGYAPFLEGDWAAFAKTALTLGTDKQLKELFAVGELDSNNPFHWRDLAKVLAKLRFGVPKSGRRRKWKAQDLCQLANDVASMANQYSKWSVLRMCEKLVRDNPRYAGQNPATLRRQFYEAIKNPEAVELIRNIVNGRDDQDWHNWLRSRLKPGQRMKASASVREIVGHEILQMIMSGWRNVERKQESKIRSKK